jgi:signal peptidase I
MTREAPVRHLPWFLAPFSQAVREQRRQVKKSKLLLEGVHKTRIYARDVLKAKDYDQLLGLEKALADGIKARDVETLRKLEDEIRKYNDRVFGKATFWDVIRENVEVFVVAIVIALAIKSYFFQPFKIPTGSMQPTLNGVILTRTDKPFPSAPVRVLDFLISGRTYYEVQARQGGTITKMESGSWTPWLEYTQLVLAHQGVETERLTIWAPETAVRGHLKITPGLTFSPGQMVARFELQTGDQVLVNKMAYHFTRPKVGQVFVFTTLGIERIGENGITPSKETGSQFYIKRCVGGPGQELSIFPPYLFAGGAKVTEPRIFEMIYSRPPPYNGYVVETNQAFMNPAGATYLLGVDQYWAMGDNSRHSKDSRYWGPVPRRNLVGTGFVVYWPFTSHWGWIE